jgi:hypothetical protein
MASTYSREKKVYDWRRKAADKLLDVSSRMYLLSDTRLPKKKVKKK